MGPSDPRPLAAAIRQRHAELGRLLIGLSDDALTSPSPLPGWSRLTIVCHLRYGAETTLAMTDAALAGRAASFYPAGRAAQRESTLHPRDGERPSDVVRSFIQASSELDRRWSTLSTSEWNSVVREPADNPDLGQTTIAALALLRSTEVEVHGLDIDLEAAPWNPVFVSEALPFRVRWLPTRRSNHGRVDDSIVGTWALAPTDGPGFTISVDGDEIRIDDGQADAPDATIVGTQAELLAFLLGRIKLADLTVIGDERVAADFLGAFPAP